MGISNPAYGTNLALYLTWLSYKGVLSKELVELFLINLSILTTGEETIVKQQNRDSLYGSHGF